jgi:predicted enzyme related to lactoylglutathione lyase
MYLSKACGIWRMVDAGRRRSKGKAMKRVTGIGGIFFKAKEPEKLYRWYEKHLEMKQECEGQGVAFRWKENDSQRDGMTVWAIFPENTEYFKNSKADHMLNYRVDDLDALLEALKVEGVEIDPHREEYDYGRFAWITDPEGNRIELWEPPK